MTDRIDMARTAYRLAMRHLHSNLEALASRDDVVVPNDPTHRRITTGWVTFDYDPFLPLAEVDDIDGETTLHPVMMTCWHVAVESMWGDRVVLTLDSIETDRVPEGATMIDFYLDDAFVWDESQSWCQHLDRLLQGTFHSERPTIDWYTAYLDR